MNQSIIDLNKVNLWDRYGMDSEKFSDLINSIEKPNRDELNFLLSTFSDEDDFGVQEVVLSALDRAADDDFIPIFVDNFLYLLKNCTQQEWAFLIIGRYVNALNKVRLKKIIEFVDIKDSLPKVTLHSFLCSDYFLNEYPEFFDLVNQ